MNAVKQPKRERPQTTAGSADYRIAVFSTVGDRAYLAAILRDALRMTEIDARIRVRNIPGVLPDRLPLEDAQRLVERIGELGGDAAMVYADDLPDLRHIPKAHHVRCTPIGLEIVPITGDDVERIGWERVALISVADVPLDTAHHYAAPRTVMVRGTPRRTDSESTTVVRGPELWLGLVDPYAAVHIDHREMNYEYLGERLTGSATTNFQEFLADLRRQAPQAILTPTAQAFLKHDSVEAYRLDTPQRHRELVELYAALVLRDRRRAAGPTASSRTGRTGKEPVMDPAISNSGCARLVELHAALQLEIDQLNAWLKEADEYGLPQFGQLGDRVLAIRNAVAEHFDLEDEGGYMAAPLATAPELTDRAAQLHAEHPRLLAEFDALAAALRECPCRYDSWGAARQDVLLLLDHLQQHEHHENDLWQEAFEAESGAGD